MSDQEGLCEEIPRKRGRPSGKNRKPLSLEERRARNALYEKERRNGTAEAMAQLAEAAGCEINTTNVDLLATVISKLQSAAKQKSSESLEDLKRVNENLMEQIATLEGRLNNECPEPYAKESTNLKQQAPRKIQCEPQAATPFHNHKERHLRKHSTKRKSKASIVGKIRRSTRDSLETDSNDFPSSSSESNLVTTHSCKSELKTESIPPPQLHTFPSKNHILDQKCIVFQAKETYIQPELRDTIEPLLPEDRSCPEPSTHSDSQSEHWNEDRTDFEETEKSDRILTTEHSKYQTGIIAQSQCPAPVSHQKLKENQRDLQNQPQPMLDLFTDSEKGFLMNCNDFFGPEEFSDRSHPNNWSFTDFITEYL